MYVCSGCTLVPAGGTQGGEVPSGDPLQWGNRSAVSYKLSYTLENVLASRCL